VARKNITAEQPWDRQENESSQAFAAFVEYRDMGAERSVRGVGQRLGKSRAIIERWSSANNWRERCRAYDSDIARKRSARYQTDFETFAERLFTLAQINAATQTKALKNINPEKMKNRELLELQRNTAKSSVDFMKAAKEILLPPVRESNTAGEILEDVSAFEEDIFGGDHTKTDDTV
jgi:hypothetical protein